MSRPHELALTNGTDEAIQLLVNTFVDAGDDVVLLNPSYAMYRFYASLAGAAIREVDYRDNGVVFPLDDLLAAIRPSTRAVLIANPNNPTGVGTSLENLRKILEAAPQAAVLIDEAYFEFSGITTLRLDSRISEPLRQPHVLESLSEWPRCAAAACFPPPTMFSGCAKPSLRTA